MLTLPESIESARTSTAQAPLFLVEVDIWTGAAFTTNRYTDVGGNLVGGAIGYTYPGNSQFYKRAISGSISYAQSKEDYIDSLSIDFDNAGEDRPFSLLFNACSINNWLKSKVRVYRTFRGLSDHILIYEGMLEPPDEIGNIFTLESRSLISSIETEFPVGDFRKTCNWVNQFAAGRRCTYGTDPGTLHGHLLAGMDTSTATAQLDPANSSREISIFVPGYPDPDPDNPDGWIPDSWITKYTPCFAVNDIIQIDSEKMLVTAVDPAEPVETLSTAVLTVTRKFMDTSTAPHSTAATVLHVTCNGTWENCQDRGLRHRFGGIHMTLEKGSYTYKAQRRMWFDKRKGGTYESEENTGIYGVVMPVSYGKVRIEPTVIWQVDAGSYNKYCAVLGWGPMANLIDAPDYGRKHFGSLRPYTDPHVVVNNRRTQDFALYRGFDGIDSQATPQNWSTDAQGWDYLWENEPRVLPSYVFTRNKGQTLSRLAYLMGSWPSTDTENPDKVDEFEAYLYGRLVDTYYASTTVPDTYSGFVDGAHNNPAWVWLDVLTNKDYGAGLDLSFFDIPKMREAASVCFTEGFTFNHTFNEKLKVIEAIGLVQNACRGSMRYRNGKYFLHVDNATEMGQLRTLAAAAGSFVFQNSSIVLGSDAYYVQDRDLRANQVEVPYLDYTQDYQTVQRILDDVENQTATGLIEKSRMKFAGVTGFDHADKLAYYQINRARIARRKDGRKKVSGDLSTLHLEIGDVVKLDLSELDLQDPDNDPTQYDGLYEITRVKWRGSEAEYFLELADPDLFLNYGIAPDVRIDPGSSRTRYPVSVTSTAAAESADWKTGGIVATWAVPAAIPGDTRPLPAKVAVLWKKSTDPRYLYQLAGVMPASANYFTFNVPPDIWDTYIDVLFAAESLAGIRQPFILHPNPNRKTYLSADVSTAAMSWLVLDNSLIRADQYVFCGNELCLCSSSAANTVYLQSSSTARLQHERTVAHAHYAGEFVAEAYSVPPVVTLYVRDLEHTSAPVNFLVIAVGEAFRATWNNPTYGRDTSPVEVPDRFIERFEICYSPNDQFDPDDPASVNTVWVRDIPGDVHIKEGVDPQASYYWAIRARFRSDKYSPWAYCPTRRKIFGFWENDGPPIYSGAGLDFTQPTSTAAKGITKFGFAEKPAHLIELDIDARTMTGPWVYTGCVAVSESELVSGIDCSRGGAYAVTLTADRTMGNFTNLLCEQPVDLRIKQDSTAAHVLTHGGSKFRFGSTIPSVVLSTGANKTDRIGYLYDAAAEKIDIVAFVKGF